MKRNWKVDNTALVGECRFWHGEPSKLPFPWVHKCHDLHPWSKTTEGRCPAAYAGKSDLCVIQKLDNIRYIAYLYEKGLNK